MTKPSKPQYLGTLPQFLGLFNCLYLTQFLTDFGQILDPKSYDQTKPISKVLILYIFKFTESFTDTHHIYSKSGSLPLITSLYTFIEMLLVQFISLHTYPYTFTVFYMYSVHIFIHSQRFTSTQYFSLYIYSVFYWHSLQLFIHIELIKGTHYIYLQIHRVFYCYSLHLLIH